MIVSVDLKQTKFENSERIQKRKLRKFHHDTFNTSCKDGVSVTVNDEIY